MDWSWFFTNFFAALLLPPLNMLIIAAFGFWQLKIRPRVGIGLIAGGLFGLGLLSTPYVSSRLLATLQVPLCRTRPMEAIGFSVAAFARARRNTAAVQPSMRVLWKGFDTGVVPQNRKPILVTGGAP